MGERSSPTGLRRFLRTLFRILVVFILLEAVLIVIFRVRWQPGIDAIKRFNKKYLNPAMMRYAGKEHWYASVVHHTGRTSGKAYATPIWAIPAAEAFFIPLPYGTDVDWCQNILETGACLIDHHGVSYDTQNPKLVTAEEAALDLPARDRMRFQTYGVDHYLRLEKTPQPIRVAAMG